MNSTIAGIEQKSKNTSGSEYTSLKGTLLAPKDSVFALRAKHVKKCRLTLVKKPIPEYLKTEIIKKRIMIQINKRFFICLTTTLIILIILASLITDTYLTNTYNAVIDSERNTEKDLQQQVDSLTGQNKILNEENSQLTNLTQPFLITSLGWYLHNSDDPVASSKNTFTIYGKIYNVGQLPANNTELTIKFYGSNETLQQTSTIQLGMISPITDFTVPLDIGTHNINCSVADSVTDVDVSLQY